MLLYSLAREVYSIDVIDVVLFYRHRLSIDFNVQVLDFENVTHLCLIPIWVVPKASRWLS